MRMLRDESSSWGRCPQTPGIYRIAARMTERGGRSFGLRSFRPLSRRSGCVPAVPYPPLRSFQSGLLQPRRAMIYQRTAITPLTSCLTPGVQFRKAFLLTSCISIAPQCGLADRPESGLNLFVGIGKNPHYGFLNRNGRGVGMLLGRPRVAIRATSLNRWPTHPIWLFCGGSGEQPLSSLFQMQRRGRAALLKQFAASIIVPSTSLHRRCKILFTRSGSICDRSGVNCGSHPNRTC